MALTLADKIKKSKLKRSQAVMSKINILWSRDGHTGPDIESQKDVDAFNLRQLFGSSASASIDWTDMGVEGLIRCYYHISWLLRGTVRNNIVLNSNEAVPSYCSTTYGRLADAASWVIQGVPHYSAYYVGWYPGDLGRGTPSDDLINRARSGELDLGDSIYMGNRQPAWNGSGWVWPADDSPGKLVNQLQQAINLIGSPSHLGHREFTIDPSYVEIPGFPNPNPPLTTPPTLADLTNLGTILGERNTDIYPFTLSIGGPNPHGDGSYPNVYRYGDGVYDTAGGGSVPAWIPTPDMYNPALNTMLSGIKGCIDPIIQYINYTKVSAPQPDYFMNLNVIPGRSGNFALQDGWISALNLIKTHIDNYSAAIAPHYSGGNSTSPAGRAAVNAALAQLSSDFSNGIGSATAIHSAINPGNPQSANYGAGFFGDPNDHGLTLWGLRTQWLKTIIDIQDGSKVILSSLSNVITTMNNNVAKAEEQFGMFGIVLQGVPWMAGNAWVEGLATPEIVGIQESKIVDTNISHADTFGDLITNGYIIAWEATTHATGYDIWRSYDWDGANGTWVKLLPAGSAFSIQDVSSANGQVLPYYVDLGVDLASATKPYYKVKAYDQGGSGDYARLPAESEVGAPKNADSFAGTGANVPPQLPPGSHGGGGSSGSGGSGGGSGAGTTLSAFWRDPVLAFTALPTEGNVDGDMRLVINEGSLYFWDHDNTLWRPLSTQSEGDTWKPPVETQSLLPTINNDDGDVRLVRDTGTLYRWNENSGVWGAVAGGGAGGSVGVVSHHQLSDMPDDTGANADHDARYPTQAQIDLQMEAIRSQVAVLQYLIPDDAAPLAGGLVIVGRTFLTAYLSHGASGGQRFNHLIPEQLCARVLRGGDLTLANPDPSTQFNCADQGELQLVINDTIQDTFDLGAHFLESRRNGAQAYTPAFGMHNLIEVASVACYNAYSQYQKGDYTLHVPAARLVSGENNVKLQHVVGATLQSTDELTVFYDPSADSIVFDTITIAQKTIFSSKYLSGVRHYALGDALTFGFDVEKLYNNTYIEPNQVFVDSSDFGVPPYWVNDTTAGSSWTVYGQPTINAILRNQQDKVITLADTYASSPHLKLQGHNLGDSAVFQSPTQNILVNTWAQRSTDKHEWFVDERYRLPNGAHGAPPTHTQGQWNSLRPLGFGELQVLGATLRYPTMDMAYGFLPTQTVNYSGYTDTRYYFRAFADSGIPHNGGNFFVAGYSVGDSNCKIHVKLPGLTGWLDLGKPYNQADFTGAEDDGCLVQQDGQTFMWTSATFSTAFSSYMVVLRVTMNPSSQPIGEIYVNW